MHEYQPGWKPDKVDRQGALYKKERIDRLLAAMIARGDGLQRKARHMSTDLDKASSIVDEALKRFSEKADALQKQEEAFVESSKKVSGAVRDATQKLADGLARIEKVANFDRLERLVDLLERAQQAITALSELDQAGRLERIAQVLK